jgi:pyridinium-3,5-bisthiocarboxylic acid mononucleotide nickel chelatase
MHIHLDPVGGIAGDMFIAAMLHAFPKLEAAMVDAIRAGGLPKEVGMQVQPFQDFALIGLRFVIDEAAATSDHDHTGFAEISKRLSDSALAPTVRDRAVAIFTLLAEVEGQIHGMPTAEVSFHELGGWDSIADIVGAAFLIETCGATSWSVGSLPKGSGTVKTAHGPLPVPSPATARLLEGYLWHDDGRAGERVTPTGAAIIRHLQCADRLPEGARRLAGSGYGFGARRFMGMSNTLRVMVLENGETSAFRHEDITVVEFELDDQTAEDIAIAVQRLRDMESVMDVLQMPAYGKKGRIYTHIQLLCAPDAIDAVLAVCFEQTSTLGVRHHIARRALLKREQTRVTLAGEAARVKLAHRPAGAITAKMESDDMPTSSATTLDERKRLRGEAEQSALDAKKR